jgi:hypothetical protein
MASSRATEGKGVRRAESVTRQLKIQDSGALQVVQTKIRMLALRRPIYNVRGRRPSASPCAASPPDEPGRRLAGMPMPDYLKEIEFATRNLGFVE